MWQRAIELADTRQLRALLGQVELAGLEGATARIRAAAPVAPMIEARRAEIESLLARAAGRPVALQIEAEAPDSSATGDSSPAPSPREASSPATGEEHPLVRRAAELFKAKVVHVEPLRRPQ